MDTSKLNSIFDLILKGETQAIMLFVHDPASQAIAASAIVGESILFNLIASFHRPKKESAPAAAAAVLTPAS